MAGHKEFRFGVLFSVLSIFGAAGLAHSALAQEAGTTAKPLTPEASLNLRFISDLQLSPDGTRLAFVVTEPATDDGRATHIWIYDKPSGGARQFTYSKKSEKWPRWSPDGKQIAFLSNRAEEEQIYVMRADGGEATALTKGKRSINSFEWSPDGKQIAFLAPDAKTEAEEKKEKDKDDAHVTDKEDKHARLWLLTVSTQPATQEAKAVTQPNWEVSEIAWLPSSRSRNQSHFRRKTSRWRNDATRRPARPIWQRENLTQSWNDKFRGMP